MLVALGRARGFERSDSVPGHALFNATRALIVRDAGAVKNYVVWNNCVIGGGTCAPES